MLLSVEDLSQQLLIAASITCNWVLPSQRVQNIEALLDVWFLIEIIGDIPVSSTSIFVYFTLIGKSNISQMFNLFACITKMKNCLLLEHRFMLQVGVKQKEERHLVDSKRLVFHS